MKIELLKDADGIRQKFIDRFLDNRNKFKTEHKEFVEELKKNGYDVDQWYDGAYMWDKLSTNVPIVTIFQALELLKSRKSNVWFMSECKGFHATCHLMYNNEKIEGFAAKADAVELGEKISYEWFESIKIYLEGYNLEQILPEDLYVFDETYEWVIVFTHETDWRVEGLEEAANTRLCFAYGFDIK